MTGRLILDTPVGPLTLLENEGALSRVLFGREEGPEKETELLKRAAGELMEYFSGRRRRFDIPLATGGSPFFRDCLNTLQKVPFGETVTYAELALRAGHPGAARAAGTALKNNPLPLFLPCHRVVAADGLGGYAGNREGMQEIKKYLLAFEREQTEDNHGRL